MPIIGWTCKGCGGREVPLDHFDNTDCGLTLVHPFYAKAVLKDRLGHYARGSGIPEVSHTLGCPRSYTIMDQESVYVDPLQFNSPLTGSGYHKTLSDAVGVNENGMLSEVSVQGVIDGMRLQGRVDVLRPAFKLIEDFKHHNDFQIKHIKTQGEKKNAQVQMSLYAELVQQTMDWRPERALVWPHFTAEYGWPVSVDVMPLDECLAYKPLDGQYTVRELLHQADESVRGNLSWKRLPMAGMTQMFGGGKTNCDYCSVRFYCYNEYEKSSEAI